TTTASRASARRWTRACTCGPSTSRTPTGSCSSWPPGSAGAPARATRSATRRGAPCGPSPPSAPVPRLRQVGRAEAGAPIVTTMYDLLFGDRDPVAEPSHGPNGTRGDWWTVFALAPDVLEHAVAGFGLYQS